VQRAIEAGDAETGIDIMQMDEGLDTGPVLLERRVSIAQGETTATLFAKLTDVAASAIVDALADMSALIPRHQRSEGISYAKKIDKSEAHIDWSQPAAVIERRLRAFDPFPGCEATLDGQAIKIWRADLMTSDTAHVPGQIIAADHTQLVVACGQGALALRTVQKPGGKRVSIGEFLRATPVSAGVQLT
jgi:methionyl-tRNA formyltransferase